MVAGELRRARLFARMFVGVLAVLAVAGRASAQLPTPWVAADIGAPAVHGSTTYSSGVFTVSAGGTGIAGRADQFHFLYQPVTGDTTLIVRIGTLVAADPGSKVGLMFRSSLAANARHAYVYINGSNGSGFYRRTSDGGRTTATSGPSAVAPEWLALRRQGSTFTAFISADRQNWQTVGSASITMGTTVYVGLAGTGNSATQALLSTASNLSTGFTTSSGGGRTAAC